MGASSSRVVPQHGQQTYADDDKPTTKDNSLLKAVYEEIASQVQQAPTKAALGRPHLTGNQAGQELDSLPACLRNLHLGMPPSHRGANVRLMKIAAVLKWSQLKAYEDVDAEAEALQVPYAGTDDELWKRVVTISWRWAKPKPKVYESNFLPMSELQFRELKALLQHAVDSSGVEYVWIDWSCVPQDSVDSMVEVHRSKVFYARARLMHILPTFEDLPEEGPVRVILAKAQRVLHTRASAAAANNTDLHQCAVAEFVIGAILEKNRTAGREYFGRVWTLAERMARHGRSEGLHNWLSLESWLGMVVDAIVKNTEDNVSSIIYKKMLGQNAAGLLDAVLGPLATAVRLGGVQAEACEHLEDKVADLCVAAVGVWLSPSNLEEAPTREWLRMYLGQEARSGIYQAWSEADRVWAIYSYFCWKRLDQRSEAGLRMALNDLAETAGGDKGTYLQGMYTQLGIAPEMDRQQDKLEAAPTTFKRWLALVMCGSINKVGAREAEITRLVGLLNSSMSVKGQEKAAKSLMTLASNDDANQVAIAQAGGIPPLVKLLNSSDTGVQEQAAGALGVLAGNDANQVAIAQAGGIPPLVKLLNSSDTGVQEQAAGALGVLAGNDANQVAIAQAGGIPPLVKLLNSSDTGLQKRAAWALAYLADKDANRVAIAQAGGIPPLVKLLDSSDTGVQKQAAQALAYLAYKDANQVAIAQASGIPPLVKLLNSSDTGLQKRAAWALAYLADKDANRVAIAEAGGIPPLLMLLDSSDTGVQEQAARALANLAYKGANQVAIAQAGGIPPLVKLLDSSDTGVQKQAAQVLAYLAYEDANRVAIAQTGGIPPLARLLYSSDTGVQKQAAWALAYLANANDANRVAIAQAGGIPPLVKLLDSSDTGVQEQAARALANLSSKGANQVAIAQAGGIPPLVKLLDSSDTGIQKQAAQALANLSSKDANQVAIAQAGGIPPLVKLLNSSDTGVQEQAAGALVGLANANDANKVAIAQAGGIPLLEKLQDSLIRKVYAGP
ncbi:hypothetical protein PLESTB_001291300 [Pleodorina starrii]|uniref:Vacuolar protein 8 n=1 Tax=Pleodorina starrii TaxID=330485 RepID=A0A9W6BT60_9CHLO|nr:hypothetical protein PLESTB_001291300 [Pleodorina starrii]